MGLVVYPSILVEHCATRGELIVSHFWFAVMMAKFNVKVIFSFFFLLAYPPNAH